jgi:hypothetical protein
MQEQELKKYLDALDKCSWIREEFSLATLADKRLLSRLLIIADDMVKCPNGFINQSCEQSFKTKAAYRFFNNPKITADLLLKPHIQQTVERVNNYSGVVLALEDTCFLNLSHMKSSTDLGFIGKKQEHSRGLIFHSRLAITEHGLALGFISQKIWARKENKNEEDKESNKWLCPINEQAQLFPNNNHLVGVSDRESDFFDFFELAKQKNQSFVVRAKHDRTLDSNKKLWESFGDIQSISNYEIEHKDDKKLIKLEIKYNKIRFTQNNKNTFIDNITAVYVNEINPPSHREPVCWMLLTNLTINSELDAKKIINYYKLRWNIEILHKIMKSGCGIELTRLETNERRFPYLTIKSIIAFRLLMIMHFGRVNSKEPANKILTEHECNALLIIRKQKIGTNFNAGKAIEWIGELAGFIKTRAYPVPGPTHTWRGYKRLQDYTAMMLAIKFQEIITLGK